MLIDRHNMEEIRSFFGELAGLDVMENFTEEDLVEFQALEDGVNICQPVSNENYVCAAVSSVMEDMNTSALALVESDSDSIVPEEPDANEEQHINRFQAVAEDFLKEAALLVKKEHPMSTGMRDDILGIMEIEVQNVRNFRKKNNVSQETRKFFRLLKIISKSANVFQN